jgi:hypothetical protein
MERFLKHWNIKVKKNEHFFLSRGVHNFRNSYYFYYIFSIKIIPLVTLLGLFKDDRSSFYANISLETLRKRNFSSSLVSPFSANALFVLYNCEGLFFLLIPLYNSKNLFYATFKVFYHFVYVFCIAIVYLLNVLILSS